MLGKLYVVKGGDTLSGIAATHLGNAARWPEIYEHNNSTAVTNRTGIKITDPDLIFINQNIYIPGNSSSRGSSVGTKPQFTPKPTAQLEPGAGKTKAISRVRSIPFKYDLNKLPPITVASPTYVATIVLNGSITLQDRNSIDIAAITRSGFQVAAKRSADYALGKLVAESQIGFDVETGRVTYECGITFQSDHPRALTTKVAAGTSSITGLPVLKGSIGSPPIKGKVDRFIYLSSGLNIDIEITPRRNTANINAIGDPTPIRVSPPEPEFQLNWDVLTGAALISGAIVICVATVGEDIATWGAGILNDAPSFAAASAMFTSGVTIIKSINHGAPIQIEGHGIAPDQI